MVAKARIPAPSGGGAYLVEPEMGTARGLFAEESG